MEKKPGNKKATNRQKDRVCKVSYVLNNDQPVRSTIIGDQPLFYMDFDETLEDELNSIDILERDLADEGDFFSGCGFDCGYGYTHTEIETSPEKLIEDFQSNLESLVGEKKSENRTNGIEDVVEIIKTSRYAASLYEFAIEYGVKVEHSDQVRNAAYLREFGIIQINPNLYEEEQALLLGRELRRVWQHRKGVLIHPVTFHPDHAILVNRAQVADLTVSMVRIAWELQLGGYRGAWHRMENSSMADFARIFAREAFLDFRTLNNGLAMAVAFETWFISERCQVQDKILIQQMLSDDGGLMLDAEECSRAVTADLISGLGEVPYGKNYLAPYASTIIIDPLFTEVRDRANANFLWFIKFEKSFRETEQELQNAPYLNDHTDMYDPSIKQGKDCVHGSTENIVDFPQFSRSCNSSDQSSEQCRRAGNADIIEFPCASGRDDYLV